MSTLNYSVIEPYNTKQIFDLVNDINAYPEFVPDCTQSGVLEQHNDRLVAFIEVAKLGFRKRFITENTFIQDKRINIQLIDGPFNYLTGRWHFIPLDPTGCQIVFNLQFQFKSRLLEYAFAPLFREIMCSMVQAFSLRAKQVYQNAY